ncbi:AraC family transcriptional regulator [Peribacillus kribbensis]|uniref:AraC family transcriptional regulator n=1 Tax=Peribacillus kribbensis TaxID=356658 RepID=UPI00041760DD|nr:AraC family transcriptional regulator [Peribacillus kribbensis]
MQIKDFEVDQSLRELTPHRTVVLPVACYETRISENIHGYIPLHWHDELQWVRVIKGEALFQINEEKVLVGENEGIFINSGRLHMAEESSLSGCVYICLNVSPDFVLPQELYTTYVKPYIQATNLSYVHVNTKTPWGKTILDTVTDIHQLMNQQLPFYEISITHKLTSIWQHILINGFPLEFEHTEMLKNQRMKQMLQWIHLHFDEKILLKDIAKEGQLSTSECCRYFKKMINQTPMNYVIEYRIQKSLTLLQQAELSITDAAYQAGFNSTSYFIDTFRKIMGVTPLSYKKTQRDQMS